MTDMTATRLGAMGYIKLTCSVSAAIIKYAEPDPSAPSETELVGSLVRSVCLTLTRGAAFRGTAVGMHNV